MNLSLRPFFILIAMLAWVAVPEAQAQRNRRGTSKEMGVQLGTAWYVGDLNPGNMLRSVSHVTRGGFYRHNLNTRWSFRGQYLQGRIEAWDADHPNGWQQNRNLHFRNQINEYSLATELNFRDHAVGNPKRQLVPFLFAGFAVYTHDPEGQDVYGNWQPLQPMGTEGQGWFEDVPNYLTWGVAVPYGLGWKGNLGSGMTFQFEWGARKTWTDYLDDVSTVYMNPSRLREARGQIAVQFADRSLDDLPAGQGLEGLQRGDPGRNDRYGYFLFSLGFRVSKKATTCWEQ